MFGQCGLVVERVRTYRFSLLGAGPRLVRWCNRIDARLPDCRVRRRDTCGRPTSARLAFRGHALRRHRCGRLHRLASPPHAPRPRPRRGRLGRVHGLLRPGAEGGERGGAAGREDRPRRGPARPRRTSTASSTWPVSRESGASGSSSRRTSGRTSSRASACSRRRSWRERKRCSRPRPRSTATRRRTRRRRTPFRARSPRTGSRSSPPSTSRAPTRRSSDCDGVVLRYFTIYGPRQRPDMAFTRMVTVARRRPPVRALRRRDAVAELHVRRRRRRGDDRGDGGRAGRRRLQRRRRQPRSRCSRRSRSSAASPAAGSSSSARRGSRATWRGPPPTRPGSRPISAGNRARPFEEGLEAQWHWAADRVAAA